MATTTTIASFSLSLPQVLRNKPTNPSPFLYVLPRFNSRFRTLTLTASAATSSNSSNRDDGFSLDDFTLHSDSRSPNNPSKVSLEPLFFLKLCFLNLILIFLSLSLFLSSEMRTFWSYPRDWAIGCEFDSKGCSSYNFGCYEKNNLRNVGSSSIW